jgi:hypothetical protein
VVLHSVSCQASLDWVLDDDSGDNLDDDQDGNCYLMESEIDNEIEEIRQKVRHRLSIADSPKTKPKGVARAFDSCDSSDPSDASTSSSNIARYQQTTHKQEGPTTMRSSDPQPALKIRRYQYLPSVCSSDDSDEELGRLATNKLNGSVVMIDSSSEDEEFPLRANTSAQGNQAVVAGKRGSHCDDAVDLCSP